MVDENNMNASQSFDPNRPWIKKLKRPVRRIAPQPSQPMSASVPASPFQAPATQAQSQPQQDAEFNLDGYLDEVNLPSFGNSATVKSKPEETPHFIDDAELDAEFGMHQGQLPAFLTKNVLILMAVVLFLAGFTIAKLFFTDQKIVRNGLQGVVVNPEVPQGRARCGIAEKTQGCVLYIMNPQRQELNARDFYDLASQLTGRQRFVIETGNMRYSNVKIRPGDIVQLNIPPL